MITFQKIPQGTLDIKTGIMSGIPSLAIKQPEPNIGNLSVSEFHNQVMDLANSKTPIEKVHQAIDAHPDIMDKPLARTMAQSVYDILGVKPKSYVPLAIPKPKLI